MYLTCSSIKRRGKYFQRQKVTHKKTQHKLSQNHLIRVMQVLCEELVCLLKPIMGFKQIGQMMTSKEVMTSLIMEFSGLFHLSFHSVELFVALNISFIVYWLIIISHPRQETCGWLSGEILQSRNLSNRNRERERVRGEVSLCVGLVSEGCYIQHVTLCVTACGYLHPSII